MDRIYDQGVDPLNRYHGNWGTRGTTSYLMDEEPSPYDYELLIAKMDETIVDNEHEVENMYKDYARSTIKLRDIDESMHDDDEMPPNTETISGRTNYQYYGSKSGTWQETHPETTMFDLEVEPDAYPVDQRELRRLSARKWASEDFGTNISDQVVTEDSIFPAQLISKFMRDRVGVLTKKLKIFSEPFEYTPRKTSPQFTCDKGNLSNMKAVGAATLYNEDERLYGQISDYYNMMPKNWQHSASNLVLNGQKFTRRMLHDEMMHITEYGVNKSGLAYSMSKKINCGKPGGEQDRWDEYKDMNCQEKFTVQSNRNTNHTKNNLGLSMAKTVKNMIDNSALNENFSRDAKVYNKQTPRNMQAKGAGHNTAKIRHQFMLDPAMLRESLTANANLSAENINAGKIGLKNMRGGRVSEQSRESKMSDGLLDNRKLTAADMHNQLSSASAYHAKKYGSESRRLGEQNILERELSDNLERNILKPSKAPVTKNNHRKLMEPSREVVNYLEVNNTKQRNMMAPGMANFNKNKNNLQHQELRDQTNLYKNLASGKDKLPDIPLNSSKVVDDQSKYGRENINARRTGTGSCKVNGSKMRLTQTSEYLPSEY